MAMSITLIIRNFFSSTAFWVACKSKILDEVRRKGAGLTKQGVRVKYLSERSSEHDVKRGTEQISQMVPLGAIRVVREVLGNLEGRLGNLRAVPGLGVFLNF